MLADTPATRRAAEKTERNIRPQSGGKRKQRVRIQRAVVHRIQSAKHGGRISAAASQPLEISIRTPPDKPVRVKKARAAL